MTTTPNLLPGACHVCLIEASHGERESTIRTGTLTWRRLAKMGNMESTNLHTHKHGHMHATKLTNTLHSPVNSSGLCRITKEKGSSWISLECGWSITRMQPNNSLCMSFFSLVLPHSRWLSLHVRPFPPVSLVFTPSASLLFIEIQSGFWQSSSSSAPPLFPPSPSPSPLARLNLNNTWPGLAVTSLTHTHYIINAHPHKQFDQSMNFLRTIWMHSWMQSTVHHLRAEWCSSLPIYVFFCAYSLGFFHYKHRRVGTCSSKC